LVEIDDGFTASGLGAAVGVVEPAAVLRVGKVELGVVFAQGDGLGIVLDDLVHVGEEESELGVFLVEEDFGTIEFDDGVVHVEQDGADGGVAVGAFNAGLLVGLDVVAVIWRMPTTLAKGLKGHAGGNRRRHADGDRWRSH
jgi:hypothetical protein